MTTSLNKILVVDDDEDILSIVKYSLEGMPGLEVTYSTSGKDALKKALENKPDLIVLDVLMPEMDGVATLQALRLIPGLERVPVAFFTANVEKFQVDFYLKQGIIGLIKKPFDPICLYDELVKLWEKSRKGS